MTFKEILARLKTVATTGSITKSSEELFISRQALITQIQLVEKELGFELFARSPKGVSLTAAGEFYLSEATKLAKSYDNILTAARELAGGTKTIRIGSLPNLPGVTLPYIASAYQKRHPEIKLQFVDCPLRDYFATFRHFGFDIMTENMMNYYHQEDDLEFLQLGSVPQHIGVHYQHPLAKKKQLDFSHLRGRRLFMYKAGIGRSEDELRRYIEANEPEIEIVDIDHYDSALITKLSLENAVVLLYMKESYPGLKSIPARWDIRIDLGIGYRKKHGENVADFLKLVEELKNTGALVV